MDLLQPARSSQREGAWRAGWAVGSGDGIGITSLECFSPPSTSPSRTALATAFWLCSKKCGCLSKLGRPAKIPILLYKEASSHSGLGSLGRASAPGGADLVSSGPATPGRGRVHPSWPMMPITHMCAILGCSLVKSSLESVEWSVYRCPLPKRLLSNFVL